MSRHHKLDYAEFHSRDLAKTKAFFEEAFDWKFTDYGDDYIAFAREGLEGGFFKSDARPDDIKGHPVLIFYSDTLEQSLQVVNDAGGVITDEIFSFPGGRRFHFTEPGGNEFAIWTETTE